MLSTKELKNQLRKKIKQLNITISNASCLEQSEGIFKEIEQLDIFKKANAIMLYWSMDDEVYTHTFVEKWWQKKSILLPAIVGDTLSIKQYTGRSSMKIGKQFSILEPTGKDFTEVQNIEIIVVPGMAFDKNNNRMGRGKGFYDKLLANTKAFKIGVCYGLQFFESIPIEEHDLPMDLVIVGK